VAGTGKGVSSSGPLTVGRAGTGGTGFGTGDTGGRTGDSGGSSPCAARIPSSCTRASTPGAHGIPPTRTQSSAAEWRTTTPESTLSSHCSACSSVAGARRLDTRVNFTREVLSVLHPQPPGLQRGDLPRPPCRRTRGAPSPAPVVVDLTQMSSQEELKASQEGVEASQGEVVHVAPQDSQEEARGQGAAHLGKRPRGDLCREQGGGLRGGACCRGWGGGGETWASLETAKGKSGPAHGGGRAFGEGGRGC